MTLFATFADMVPGGAPETHGPEAQGLLWNSLAHRPDALIPLSGAFKYDARPRHG